MLTTILQLLYSFYTSFGPSSLHWTFPLGTPGIVPPMVSPHIFRDPVSCADSLTVAIAAYNLGIQVVSFGIIGSFAYVDSKTLERSSWYNHVFFEIILYSVLAVLQLGPFVLVARSCGSMADKSIAGSLAYSALAHRFDCSGSASACILFGIRSICAS